MAEYNVGGLVKSMAGHDKGNLFIIIEESGEYVYLVDGIYRTMDKPKTKKKRHVQIVNVIDETLNKKLIHGEHVRDEEIKFFIKCYKRENQVI